ncbi:MAG: DUF393 domain-containing protein [Chloroflexi bacterium]|uniref:DUF393 domain-containing protein n=1 Tax=Candidatus Chlorohelix allophototropha TaxID=3003348 RepID=A0A8T7M687_9CHLR|nr:DUF393 domain-containing protein [Chloroflexota bacterium]WJW69503.1 DUF393 domain-containing protein [Chloroflexota bacterium L227-S17]
MSIIKKPPALLLYDATCRFCTASSQQALKLAPKGSIKPLDINNPEIQARYHIKAKAAQREMHIVTPEGKIIKGAQAVRYILYLNKGLKPLSYLWKVPGFDVLAQSAYLLVADNRYLLMGKQEVACQDDACEVYLGKSKS